MKHIKKYRIFESTEKEKIDQVSDLFTEYADKYGFIENTQKARHFFPDPVLPDNTYTIQYKDTDFKKHHEPDDIIIFIKFPKDEYEDEYEDESHKAFYWRGPIWERYGNLTYEFKVDIENFKKRLISIGYKDLEMRYPGGQGLLIKIR
jgi:hypothetical protein